jgi:hypothetical protein
MLINNLEQALIESTCEIPCTGILNMPQVLSSVQYYTLVIFLWSECADHGKSVQHNLIVSEL